MSSGKRFEDLLVKDARDFINTMPPMVRKGASLRQVVDCMLVRPLSRTVYVIDVDGNLAGVVTSDTILKHVGYRVGVRGDGARAFIGLLRNALKDEAGQVMQAVRPVREGSTLKEALFVMLDHGITEVPVVDDDYKLLGELMGLELISAAKDLLPGPDP
jgi:CBS domain-containing protein